MTTHGLSATVDKVALLKLLNGVKDASSNKAGATPVYQMVRFDATAGRLRATCFNGDWLISGSIPAQCMDAWTVHVPVRTLVEVINTMASPVSLSVADNHLLLNCKEDKAKINGSADDLPIGNAVENDEALVLTGRDIQYLNRIIPFAATTDERPLLQSIHLTLEASGDTHRLRGETADGFQAARIFVPLPYKPLSALDILLPASFFQILVRSVGEKDQIKIWADPNRITFAVTGEAINFTFSSSLMAGAFPDLGEILKAEKSATTTLTFDMPGLLRFAKRARVFAAKDKPMVLQIKDIGGTLNARAMARSDEIGETRDSIGLSASSGREMLFAINCDKTIALCEAVDEQAPAFKLLSENAPIIVRCPKSDLAIITMPMHLDDALRAKLDLFDDLPIAVSLPTRADVEAAVAA